MEENMNLILKATEYNWGLMYPGCWKSKTWIVYENGVCDVTIDYVLGESKKQSTSIPEQNLSQLRSLRTAKWEPERTRACDGTAWIITAYEGEHVIQTTGDQPRYTYGLGVLEKIESLLPRID